MITIVESKDYITRLWGKQTIKSDKAYRLMKYVLPYEYDNNMLLHNVVTGQMVVLNAEEKSAIKKSTIDFDSDVEQLIADHFIVPVDYDEHQQVLNLRLIIRKLDNAQENKPILHYTILPTTACNARCYYCFEQGIVPTTMSEETAEDVVEFIAKNCGNERTVVITWFGGEPTVASSRIDQICSGLAQRDIRYRSKMVTNGYLFDQDMVHKAKELWHLYSLQICVDGTEKSYNRIKSYVAAHDNPYQRILRNIGLLLDHKIAVGLRMNFDLGNYSEFYDLVNEVTELFPHNEYLFVSAHPVIGEYKDNDGIVLHGDDDWFSKQIVEFDDFVRKTNTAPPLPRLPFLNGDLCSASTGYSIVIRPDGGLTRCSELFADTDLIGTLREGVVNHQVDDSWKNVADYDMCANCLLFPHCLRLANCPNKTYCHKLNIYTAHYKQVMENKFKAINN